MRQASLVDAADIALRGKPLPETCTIKVPQYHEIRDVSAQIKEKNGLGGGSSEDWVVSSMYTQVDTETPLYRRHPAFGGWAVPVTHDCENESDLETCTKPFVMDYKVDNNPKISARVAYEIIRVDECDGSWKAPGSKDRVPVPTNFARTYYNKTWGASACQQSAKCVPSTESGKQTSPFKCECVAGWNGAGSHAYNTLSAAASEKWGEHGYPNVKPQGYDAALAAKAPGCIDNHPPEVSCQKGPALKKTLKVGCDCDDLGVKSWKTELDTHAKLINLGEKCTMWDYDRNGDKVTLKSSSISSTGGVTITPGCDAREDVCEAYIMVSGQDEAGNKATPTKLTFKFSARDSMQLMEERLVAKMDKIASDQLAATQGVKDTVIDTKVSVESLNDCTSDMCNALKLLKFSRLCWLALFILLINGVHIQFVRALFVAAHCGNIYYPNEQEHFESGAGLYLMVTRFGFMDARERQVRALDWWTEMGEDKEHEE